MKNGSKFIIEKDDLLQEFEGFTFIIKGVYYFYNENKCYYQSYHGDYDKDNPRGWSDKKIKCDSLDEFLDFLNFKMQQEHFSDKFENLINEK